MTTLTPIYGITKPDDYTVLADIAAVIATNADTLETALKRGGIAPPAAQDLAAVAGRVNRLETLEPAAGVSWDAEYQPSSAQSIPTGADTTVLFQTATRSSPMVTYAAGVFTVVAAGVYAIGATVRFVTSASAGERYVGLIGAASGLSPVLAADGGSVASGAVTRNIVVPGRAFAVNDKFRVNVFQGSGAAIPLELGGAVTRINIARLR